MQFLGLLWIKLFSYEYLIGHNICSAEHGWAKADNVSFSSSRRLERSLQRRTSWQIALTASSHETMHKAALDRSSLRESSTEYFGITPDAWTFGCPDGRDLLICIHLNAAQETELSSADRFHSTIVFFFIAVVFGDIIGQRWKYGPLP